MNYSVTFVGILTAVLGQFLPAELVGELAADLVLVGGLIITWYGRFRKGDVNIVGVKK